MRYYTAALVLLAGLGLVALTEPWPTTDRKTWPIVANCRDDFCDCPEASNALLCHDFEEGETDCAVSRAYGSLNLLGEIGYVNGTPDCADATSPLDGTYSYEAVIDIGIDGVSYWPVDVVGDTNICESDKSCVMTMLANIQNDDDALINASIAALYAAGGGVACSAHYRPNNDFIRPQCDVGLGVGFAISTGTTYKLCLKYVADDCTIYVDAETGTWCTGAVGSSSKTTCLGGHAAVLNASFGNVDNSAVVNLDNVLWTDE